MKKFILITWNGLIVRKYHISLFENICNLLLLSFFSLGVTHSTASSIVQTTHPSITISTKTKPTSKVTTEATTQRKKPIANKPSATPIPVLTSQPTKSTNKIVQTTQPSIIISTKTKPTSKVTIESTTQKKKKPITNKPTITTTTTTTTTIPDLVTWSNTEAGNFFLLLFTFISALPLDYFKNDEFEIR